MEIIGLIIGLIGLVFAFNKPKKIVIELFKRTFPSFKTYSQAELGLSLIKFERGLNDYNPTIRVYNPHNNGDTIILSKLFLELCEVQEHPETISGEFYGAPIHKTEIKNKRLKISSKLGKYLVFTDERKFPPNEIEDFEFRFVMDEGKKYLLRFGTSSYIIGDKEMTKSYTSNWYWIGYPNLSYEDSDEYIPKNTFLDEPKAVMDIKN